MSHGPPYLAGKTGIDDVAAVSMVGTGVKPT